MTATTVHLGLLGILTRRYVYIETMIADLAAILDSQTSFAAKRNLIEQIAEYCHVPDNPNLVENTDEPAFDINDLHAQLGDQLDEMELARYAKSRVLDESEWKTMAETLTRNYTYVGKTLGLPGQHLLIATWLRNLFPLLRKPAEPAKRVGMEQVDRILAENPQAFVAFQAVMANQDGISIQDAMTYIIAQRYDQQLTMALATHVVSEAVRQEHNRLCPLHGNGPGLMSGGIFGLIGALGMMSELDDLFG